MDRCASCGATLAPGAAWCGQCFASTAAPPPPSFGFRPAAASAPAPQVLTRTTRWGKTPTTFGPLGRVLATLAVLIPLLVMVAGGFADMFAWGGAAVYAAIVLPWAMRDIWKAGRLPVR